MFVQPASQCRPSAAPHIALNGNLNMAQCESQCESQFMAQSGSSCGPNMNLNGSPAFRNPHHATQWQAMVAIT